MGILNFDFPTFVLRKKYRDKKYIDKGCMSGKTLQKDYLIYVFVYLETLEKSIISS